MTGVALLVIYVLTLAPSVTFWDAGELIASAHVLGIPHPPGTPLYIMLGHVWSAALGPFLGVARAMNLLSAVCTALAGAGMAWLIARRSASPHGGWFGVAAALGAGTMMSVWSNATETEVYAISLLHSVAMLVAASRIGDEGMARDERWVLLTAYLIALAPAVHLSSLVAAPSAIALASREQNGSGVGAWRVDRVTLLVGAFIAAAGVGRASWIVAGIGVALAFAPTVVRSVRLRTASRWLALIAIGTSALAILLVRARHDPAINQGNPNTMSALLDVVARRQYDVAPLFPRQSPVLWQAINLFQYVDWQAAMSWGSGVVTSPARVIAALAWIGLAWVGLRAMRRDSRSLADALLALLLCGTVGVAVYLNLKLGASLGWGLLSDRMPHEARERDYFFVLGFWAWGSLAGYGAVALARARGWRPAAGLLAVLLPLAGNWKSADRSREPSASAARHVAMTMLESTPPNAVLFVDGDNDSYPLWYVQQVERYRQDVMTVTIPLLPASWYPAELERRTGWRWLSDQPVSGAVTLSQQRAALFAGAAHRAGRPVAASLALPSRERGLLGADWVMRGPVYVARSGRAGGGGSALVDSAAAMQWLAREGPLAPRRSMTGDDVAWVMLSLLQCPRLAQFGTRSDVERDSLEVRCNFR